MRDDFLTLDWADNHRTLSHDLHDLIDATRAGFTRLVAIRFAAPWRITRIARSRRCA